MLFLYHVFTCPRCGAIYDSESFWDEQREKYSLKMADDF